MAEKPKVLGVDAALVNLKEGGSAVVKRGEDLPADITDAEKKRLKDLGVLDAPKDQPTYAEQIRAGQGAAPTDDARVKELEAQLAEALAAKDAAEQAAAKAAEDAAKDPAKPPAS